MLRSFLSQPEICIFGLFAIMIYQKAKSEVFIDVSKVFKRHEGEFVAFADFAAHSFYYLNTIQFLCFRFSWEEISDCGKLCVDHFSCFSFNVAALSNVERNISCELLPSDKYSKSSKFVFSRHIFHHFSIKVGYKNLSSFSFIFFIFSSEILSTAI